MNRCNQMNDFNTKALEAWEDDGGAVAASPRGAALSLSGTVAQLEWTERIKQQVDAEFDRVAASFRSIAGKQGSGKHATTGKDP